MAQRKRKQRNELCVAAYIRQHFNIDLFPADLRNLCLELYHVPYDEWNKERSDADLTYSADNDMVMHPSGSAWTNAFGTMQIQKGELQSWELKMVGEGTSFVLVGIMEISQANRSIPAAWEYFCYYQDAECKGYGYYSLDGEKLCGSSREPYGATWHRNDVIQVTLDMRGDHGRLSFAKNGHDQGIAFANIDIEQQYCLALALYQKDAAVQLIRE